VGKRRVRATADFDAEVADDLTFRVGDVMTVLEQFEGWLKCDLHGRVGLVPDTLVAPVNDAIAPPPAIASPRGLAMSGGGGLHTSGGPPAAPPPAALLRSMSPPPTMPAQQRGPPAQMPPKGTPSRPSGMTFTATSMRGPPSTPAPLTSGGSVRAMPAAAATLVGRQVRAIAKFDLQVPEDLPFAAGDVLNIIGDLGGGWLKAESNGKTGQIPASYVVDAGSESNVAAKAPEQAWQPLTSGMLFQPIAATDARGNDACERCKVRKVRARVKLEALTLLLCKQCFPEHDHQLLTNRGFLFLDQVEAYRDAHGGSLAGLLVASFDAESRCIVYKEPRALVVNAPGSDVVELSDADEHWRWTAGADVFGAAPLPASARALSVCTTRSHELFVARGDDECFAKRTMQSLLEDESVTAARVLAVAPAPPSSAAAPPEADAAPLERLGAALVGGADGDDAALLAADGTLPAWVWQLSATALRRIVCGAQAAMPTASAALVCAGVAARDDLMRLLLHAGFSATFSVRSRAPLRWAIVYSDDAELAEPTLRLACAPGKRAHADVLVEHAAVPRRTWCFDVQGGFVVVRRALRVSAARFAAVLDAQRALAAAPHGAADAAAQLLAEAERAALASSDDDKQCTDWVVVQASRATVQGNCTLQAQEMDQAAEQTRRLVSAASGKGTKDGKYPFTLRPPSSSVLKAYVLIASSPGDAVAWVEAIRASINGASLDPQTGQPWRHGFLQKKGAKRWFALDVKGQALYWFNKEVPLQKDDKGLLKNFKNLAPLAVYRFCDLQESDAVPADSGGGGGGGGGGTMVRKESMPALGERMTSESEQPVLVAVLCHGERKTIPLNPRWSVAEAIGHISGKFAFVNTDGYQLCMGVERTVLKTDSLLWRYKLGPDDELELRAPLRNGTIRVSQGDVAALLRRPWGLASLGPGYRTNEDRAIGLRQQIDELTVCLQKTRTQVGWVATAETQDTEAAIRQLEQFLMTVEADLNSLGGAGAGGAPASFRGPPAPPGRAMAAPSMRTSPSQPMGFAPPSQPMGFAPPSQPMGFAPPSQPMGFAPPSQPTGFSPPDSNGGFMQRAPTIKPLPKLPPPLADVGAPAGALQPPTPGRPGAGAMRPMQPVAQQRQAPPPMNGAARLPPNPGAPDRAALLRKASEAAVGRPLPAMAPPLPGGAPADSGLSGMADREARLAAQEAQIAAQEAELAAERQRLAQLRKAQHRLTMTVAASLLDDEMNGEAAAAEQAQHAIPPPPPIAMGSVPLGVVTCECEYAAEEERELSMTVGEELLIILRNDATGWYLAQRKYDASAMGWVPSTLISSMRPL
jgi:hypothetical protein